jgi:hypothetical protein
VLSTMSICRRRAKGILAIGLSLSLALALLGPSIAIACEGGGEVVGESEGEESLGGHTYELNAIKGEKKTIHLTVRFEKAEFGSWTETGDTTNWNVLERTSCENQTFSPGTGVCNIGAEVASPAAKEIALTVPITFRPNGDKKTYEVKFKTK